MVWSGAAWSVFMGLLRGSAFLLVEEISRCGFGLLMIVFIAVVGR
jgi:hypothetical protein